MFLPLFWCSCMAINVSVQYDGGFLPDILLLILCYYLLISSGNPIKCHAEFSSFYSLCSRLNILIISPPMIGWIRFRPVHIFRVITTFESLKCSSGSPATVRFVKVSINWSRLIFVCIFVCSTTTPHRPPLYFFGLPHASPSVSV